MILKNKVITTTPTLTTTSLEAGDEDGLYVSTATNSGNPTYYFRGAVENNYVSFADFTWRIVRVNEDGTIRIVMQDGINDNALITFNPSYNSYTYMYYTNNSNAKTQLESWYQTNIGSKSDLASKVATGDYYCEQAKVKCADSATSGNATMTTYTSYTPNFKCSNDGNGKGLVNASVGLLTYDEVVYAGGYFWKSNDNYYLYNSNLGWPTMSPAGFGPDSSSIYVSTIYYVNTAGLINNLSVNDVYKIRPVLNLSADTLATGSGTSTDPYVVNLAKDSF